MGDRQRPSVAPVPEPESYGRLLANLGGLVAGLAAVAWGLFAGVPAKPPPPPAPVVVQAPAPEPPKVATPVVPPAPVAVAPPAPVVLPLNREAVGKAEADVDAASRDRARAEARADGARRRLEAATAQAAADARAAKTLAFRVRDPSARVTSAAARGGFLRAERDKLKGEVVALSKAPRPTAKVLSNKNPVARPAEGEEFHFELRKNRVSFIDLNRLLDMVKTDARLRIRLSDGARLVSARVGPVGPFALDYSLARTLPAGIDDLIESRGVRYDLRGWEVIPEFEGRGETFEATRQPISEFARTIRRLNPARDSVTLWVFPDGFDLYRKLRDDLHARGFMVAARPLPAGMAIRGSPSGSLSAGQ